MARLYGDDIQKYIQYKKGVKPKRGILSNMAVGLTEPFGRFSRSLEGISGLEEARAYGKADEYTPDFMTPYEYERWRKGPALEAAKGGVGMASFLTPGPAAFSQLGGLGSTLASAGISGGAYGFGESEPGKELETTAQSALGSMVFAGGLYGAGKLAKGIGSKLKSKPQGQTFYGGEVIPNEAVGVNKLKDLGLLDDMGKPVALPGEGVITESGDPYNQIANLISQKLKDNPEKQQEAYRALLSILPENFENAAAIENIASMAGVTDAGQYAYMPGSLTELPQAESAASTLMKTGRDMEYDSLGMKPVKNGPLSELKTFTDDKAALDKGLEMTGYVDNAGQPIRNSDILLGDFPSRLDAVRERALYDTPISTTQNNMVDSVAERVMTRTGEDEVPVKMAIAEQIRDILQQDQPPITDKAATSAMMTGEAPINQFDLDKMAQGFKKTAWDVTQHKGEGKITSEVQAALHDYATKALKDTTPAYKDANRAFWALYRQKQPLLAQVNRGKPSAVKSATAPWTAAYQVGAPKAQGFLGRQMESAGRKLGPIGDLTGKIPVEQLRSTMGPAANKLIPYAGAQMATGGYGGGGGMTDSKYVAPTNTGAPGDVLGMSGVSSGGYSDILGTGGGQDQSRAELQRRILTAAVLSGNMEAAQANFAMQALGISPDKQELTAQEKDYQMAANVAQQALTLLDTEGGAGKVAQLGRMVSSPLGIETSAQNYKDTLELMNAYVRKALVGTQITAIELKNLGFIPSPNDEPAIARNKLKKLIAYLQSYGNIPTAQGSTSEATDLLGAYGY